jgi:putative transposase
MGHGVQLSMDGRGAWRSIKYKRVYLRAYDSVSVARTDIAQYIKWYKSERDHSSLGDETPEQVWLSNLPPRKEAA